MGVKIYNSDLTKELRDGAKIQVSVDGIPSELAEKVIPTMEVNPELLRKTNLIKVGSATNAVTTLLLTTATDRETYLVGATLSYIKDVTSTATLMSLLVVPDGQTAQIQLLAIPGITLTAAQNTLSISLAARPLKLAKGTNINVSNDTDVGNIKTTAVIMGYTVSNILA